MEVWQTQEAEKSVKKPNQGMIDLLLTQILLPQEAVIVEIMCQDGSAIT